MKSEKEKLLKQKEKQKSILIQNSNNAGLPLMSCVKVINRLRPLELQMDHCKYLVMW